MRLVNVSQTYLFGELGEGAFRDEVSHRIVASDTSFVHQLRNEFPGAEVLADRRPPDRATPVLDRGVEDAARLDPVPEHHRKPLLVGPEQPLRAP